MLHGLPLLLTSGASLLIFYPALMTSDSLDQWRQSGQLAFNDAHPLLYGLLMVAMRTLWDSPSAVALVQAVFFAAMSGWLIAVMRRVVDAGALAAWLSSWLVALFPLLPLTAVTLWKDVPYAAAVVGLTAFVIARLPATRARISTASAVGLGLLMFCAMAMRHNGPPVAFAAALALIVVARHSWLRVVLALLGAVALMVLLKGPISSAMDIEKKSVGYVLYSHHIAAHLAADHEPAAPQDEALLRQINASQTD